MKSKIINLIVSLGMGLNELIFDFEIDNLIFNSIEWDPESDDILLHIFIEDKDIYCNFEGIDIDKQIKIFKILENIKK